MWLPRPAGEGSLAVVSALESRHVEGRYAGRVPISGSVRRALFLLSCWHRAHATAHGLQDSRGSEPVRCPPIRTLSGAADDGIAGHSQPNPVPVPHVGTRCVGQGTAVAAGGGRGARFAIPQSRLDRVAMRSRIATSTKSWSRAAARLLRIRSVMPMKGHSRLRPTPALT
jgi:hypothetical protein